MCTFSRLISLFLLISLLLPHGPVQGAAADATASAAGSVSGFKADLLPTSDVYEMNLDGEGNLWISDYGANAVWKINPVTSDNTVNYTIFEGITTPSDARVDTAGNLWWADYDNARLGRLAPGSSQADTWILANDPVTLYGTFVDSAGRLWVSDSDHPYLFRFNPAQNNELCTYTLPGSGALSYLAESGGAMWTVDDVNARLYRVNVNSDPVTFTYWALPENSMPEAIAAGPRDTLAWIDGDIGNIIAWFDPATNQMTQYAAPSSPVLGYIASTSDKFLFSQAFPAGFGWLNPTYATGLTATLQPALLNVRSVCKSAGVGTAIPVTSKPGTLIGSPATYPAASSGNAWKTYNIDDPSASPTGIAFTQGRIWMADRGRGKLVFMAYGPGLELSVSGQLVDSNANGQADAGEQIHYAYTVSNTGDLTLHDVVVSDPKVTVTGGPITLNPGTADTTTFQGSYTITSADIQAGSVTNQSTADASETWPVSAGTSVTLPQVNAISFHKSGVLNPGEDNLPTPGDVISYQFEVSNTGNTILTGISVTDPLPGLSGITCPVSTTLLPGESLNCTASYSITQDDIDAGSVNNTATVNTDQTGQMTASEVVGFSRHVYLPMVARP